MIETEEQRRWWFATHPEYRWSRRGTKIPPAKGPNEDKVDPKEVGAYVDKALKYVHGPVADLLKSVRRNFGVENDSAKGSTWDTETKDAWLRPAGYCA